MRPLILIAGACLALAACEGDERPRLGSPSTPAFQIGPVIDGRNHSEDCPRDFAGSFTINPCQPGYVTMPTGGPLAGKRAITIRFRLDVPDGAVVHPVDYPERPATLALYFQRAGDDWSARGEFEHYRWYCLTRPQLVAGEQSVTCPLAPAEWKSVQSDRGTDRPDAFAAALLDAERVGFVLGGGSGAGHGIVATAPVRFTVLHFAVE